MVSSGREQQVDLQRAGPHERGHPQPCYAGASPRPDRIAPLSRYAGERTMDSVILGASSVFGPDSYTLLISQRFNNEARDIYGTVARQREPIGLNAAEVKAEMK